MAVQPFDPEEICHDPSFIKLASSGTSAEAFTQHLEERVCGYTQKKRLVDGLKPLLAKVEVVDQKLSVIKAVGKAKQLEEPEIQLLNLYAVHNLKEKISAVNAMMQTQLEEGKISTEEKPQVLENFNSRKEKAKNEKKDKVVEKLERNIGILVKIKPYQIPVTNVMEIFKLRRKLKEVETLEKRAQKSLSSAQVAQVEGKAALIEELKNVESSGKMWFESELEFKGRLDRALEELARNEAELLRKEQEEAWEREREEERKALEEKRLAAERKREEEERKLIEKLEAKRLEDQAKPQKVVAPAPKKKEKAKGMKMDPKALFADPADLRRQKEEEEEEARRKQEEQERIDAERHALDDDDDDDDQGAAKVTSPKDGKANSSTTGTTTAQGYPKTSSPEKEKPKAPPAPPKVSKPKIVLENKWGEAPAGITVEEDNTAVEDLPSLSEALVVEASSKAAAKKPTGQAPPAAAAPKKKEKKKFTKMSVTDLGFDCNNPNYN
mmetsp:Transcript_30541/g.65795  ORF Transcript_30541/g.65795 Transcript_30541/m.65795 type:complete len:496 (+) Transcript_30541:116-1603(+)|eukprot:CAMPEP_0206452636 /NCGR_PEP_ID=MMETSP0324_2-20121206/20067_1 /ASSEMBLY_ACC=CAM_ASM_000836 /TAXON_ID=2866 /ORGANISM="Crypthecodinium cohnii, Strain Seligo" /LENGTH=495 /DNA_ID=CAMNT_0053922771 /DNA_START=111 /DNA_END=1598 /DNA_ORIENTATION=+